MRAFTKVRGSLALRLCRRRVLRGERLILEFLEAWDAGEMGNVEAAIERLRRYLGGI